MKEESIQTGLNYLALMSNKWDEESAFTALRKLSKCFDQNKNITIHTSLYQVFPASDTPWGGFSNDHWGAAVPDALRKQIFRNIRKYGYLPKFVSLIGERYCVGLRSIIRKTFSSKIRFERKSLFESGYYDVFDFALFLIIFDRYTFPGFEDIACRLRNVFTELIQSRIACVAIEQHDIHALRFPKIMVDEARRLHSTDQPALMWKDDYYSYWIQGVQMPALIWKLLNRGNIKEQDIIEILSHQNIEVRNVALRMIGGAGFVFENTNFRLVHQTARNMLYSLDGVFKKSMKVLRYRCPSTNREYFKFVPPDMTDADHAQAWSFQLTPEEYESILVET